MKNNLLSHPNPARTYEQAVRRFDQLALRSTAGPLNPTSKDILLTYHRKVERTVVLLHGYTNSPQQFRQLGGLFHAAGYNVLIPRMPRHGLSDVLNKDQAQLTAQEMVAYADTAIDIATGLGEHITVMGISAGGNLTGWLLHQRPEIDCAVLVAPAFGLGVVKTPLTKSAMQVALKLPNRFIPKGDDSAENDSQSAHAYPQISTRAVANVLKVGQTVVKYSSLRQPFPEHIFVVTNDNDTNVNNALTEKVVKNWRNLGINVQTHQFEQSLGLPHDTIDPGSSLQNIGVVYPLLVNSVENCPSSTPAFA